MVSEDVVVVVCVDGNREGLDDSVLSADVRLDRGPEAATTVLASTWLSPDCTAMSAVSLSSTGIFLFTAITDTAKKLN